MATKKSHAVPSLKIGEFAITKKQNFNLNIDVPLYDFHVLSENKDFDHVFTLSPKNMLKIADLLKETAKEAEKEWNKLKPTV